MAKSTISESMPAKLQTKVGRAALVKREKRPFRSRSIPVEKRPREALPTQFP